MQTLLNRGKKEHKQTKNSASVKFVKRFSAVQIYLIPQEERGPMMDRQSYTQPAWGILGEQAALQQFSAYTSDTPHKLATSTSLSQSTLTKTFPLLI